MSSSGGIWDAKYPTPSAKIKQLTTKPRQKIPKTTVQIAPKTRFTNRTTILPDAGFGVRFFFVFRFDGVLGFERGVCSALYRLSATSRFLPFCLVIVPAHTLLSVCYPSLRGLFRDKNQLRLHIF
jgi:hypothetical protein